MTKRKEKPAISSSDNNRRDAIKTLGLGALGLGVLPALAASTVVLPASAAEPDVQKVLPALNTIPGDAPIGKLNSAQKSAMSMVRIKDATPITGMGLTAEGIRILTPNAHKLTKADLVAMTQGNFKRPNIAALTVYDLASISSAFGKFYQPGAGGELARNITINISHCCCCCCCAIMTPNVASIKK